MNEVLSFALDWSSFLVLELAVAAAFIFLAVRIERRLHPLPTIFAHVQVFLRPDSHSVTRSGITTIQRNYFHSEARVEQAIQELGGEVLSQLRFNGPLIAKLPPRAIPQLLQEKLVDRVETSRVISLKFGRKRV